MHEKEHKNKTSQNYNVENSKKANRQKDAKRWLRRDFLERWLWNYGFGVFNILVSALIFIFIFAGMFCMIEGNFFESFTRSLVSFTTLGFLSTSSTLLFINFLMAIESFIGAIYIAIAASMFYTHARRTF